MLKEQCISCGRDDRPLVAIKEAFMSNDFKLCVVCASRFEGKSGVGAEADRLMTEVQIEPNHRCVNCGDLVLPRGEDVPLYCDTCAGAIYKTFKELL